jgi:hypothetical protein
MRCGTPAATVTVRASSSTLMGKSAGMEFLWKSLGSEGLRMLQRRGAGREWVTDREGGSSLARGGTLGVQWAAGVEGAQI